MAYRVFWVQDDLAFLRECQTASCMAGYDVEAFDNSMTTLHQLEWVLNVLTCYAPGLGFLRGSRTVWRWRTRQRGFTVA